MDIQFLDYFVQNGFAIAVAIFLLYKDAKFNMRVAEALERVSVVLETICKEKRI